MQTVNDEMSSSSTSSLYQKQQEDDNGENANNGDGVTSNTITATTNANVLRRRKFVECAQDTLEQG